MVSGVESSLARLGALLLDTMLAVVAGARKSSNTLFSCLLGDFLDMGSDMGVGLSSVPALPIRFINLSSLGTFLNQVDYTA